MNIIISITCQNLIKKVNKIYNLEKLAVVTGIILLLTPTTRKV